MLFVSVEGEVGAVMLWIAKSQLEDQRCSLVRSMETVARRIGRDAQRRITGTTVEAYRI